MREEIRNTSVWSLIPLVLIAISISRLLRRIIVSMRAKGEDKFVSPIKNGRVWNIVLYQLGQICVITGVISQFG